MTAVSDTSPINYFVLIDSAHILLDLFGRVVVPQAVRDELLAAGAPDKVKNWIANAPDWFEVQQSGTVDSSLNRLGDGERETITLAQSLGASLLLIDEIEGRRAALERGLKVAGTVGILELAAASGLIDPTETVKQLRATNFRISPRRIQQIVKSTAERAKIRKRVYPHLLRHSVATTLLERGMPIDQIQKFLGHSKLETTQVYVESMTEIIKESYRWALSE